MNKPRYVVWCGGCEVCGFTNLKDAIAELNKYREVNAYIVDTKTGKEYYADEVPNA